MVSINSYLDEILEDFQEYLRAGVKLCALKSAHYDAGKIPDYTDIHTQQYYLLRYAYAYAFEYKLMYDYLLDNMDEMPTIEVMSIGCGNMIDYWSLAQVVGSRSSISYKGYDSVDWAYKFTRHPGDRVNLTIGDAVGAIEDLSCFSADVLVFPKSISEFSAEEIDVICKCIREKEITKDSVFLLVSLRTDQYSLQRDIAKAMKIYDAMEAAGFECEDDKTVVKQLANAERKIREVDSSFRHPGEVIDQLKELSTYCIEFKNNGKNCKHDCGYRLNRWPILNCQDLRFQCFKFTRR